MKPKSDNEVAAEIAAAQNELHGLVSVVEIAASKLQELRAEKETLNRNLFRVIKGVEGDFTRPELIEYEGGRFEWVGGKAKWVRNV
jgi:hypothetical protein